MRYLSIDVLKIALAFCVVFLHMHILRDSYPVLSFILVNGIFRIAVPTFLIITGYYFYDVKRTDQLKKWLVRTFLLYLIWSLVYIPFWRKEDIWTNIVLGYHHLWYLIGTIFSALLLFLIRKASVKVLSILVILLFSLGYGIQTWGNLHYFKGEADTLINQFSFYRNFLFMCFPFLTIGYLINKLSLNIKYKPSLLIVVIMVGLVALESFCNYAMINPKDNVDMLFSLLIACPLVFIYCKRIPVLVNTKILANLSTAIYLVHPLLMKWVLGMNIPFEIPVFLVVLLASNFVLIIINRRLKYIL